MTVRIDDEAVLWRHADRDDAPLLVLLHGVGSHEADLFGLVPELPTDATVASLRAPLPWPGGGRAWFELGMDAGGRINYDPAQVDVAAEAVLTWLDTLETRPERVVLIGFSQGAATALRVATLAPERLAAVALLSGLLPFDEQHAGPATRLPAFVAIGEHDEVIGERRAPLERWASTHLDATVKHYPMGHWVVPEEMADLRAFLGSVLQS